MWPTLQLGSWQVGTYLVFAALGLIVAAQYALGRALSLGYSLEVVALGVLLTVGGAFIGVFVLQALITGLRIAWVSPLAPPEGLSIIGGLLGGAIVLAPYARHHRASLAQVADVALLPAPLGLAIGRLGCLAAGCCYGKPTDSWLGMYLPDDYGFWAVRYPTQLLSGVANLLIFLVLLAVERYGLRRADETHGGRIWPFDGFLALLFMSLYALKRFVIGFLRESAVPEIGPLSLMHFQAAVALAAALALLAWNMRRMRKEKSA